MSSSSEMDDSDESYSSGSQYLISKEKLGLVNGNGIRFSRRLFEEDDTSSDYDVRSVSNENHEVNIFSLCNSPTADFDQSIENATVLDIAPDTNVSISSLVPYSDTENEELLTPMKTKKLTRKRKRNPHTWKKNVRKFKRQRGEEYLSTTGKTVSKKKVEHLDCKCKYKCTSSVSKDDRESLMMSFYSLDENGKKHYILQNSECGSKKRGDPNTRKKNSFSYFLHVNNIKVRVCKNYFLKTLIVSQKTVYNTHFSKDKTSNTPKSDERGKKTQDRISTEAKDMIRKHIQSFPRAESHYCRASTKKEYLCSSLNLTKMYDLYVEECQKQNIDPLKDHMYRSIFNFEFNIEFLAPKSDRCDLCEEYAMAKKENRLTDELTLKVENHVTQKTFMRQERKQDRESKNLVVCFDLQNVIALPRANVSCFFYKRKLNVYNLTAHASDGVTKQGYCAIWNEAMCGRAGNDIASAVIKLLTKICNKYINATDIILWSDSCVPQNRNSIISYALAEFLQKNSRIKSIILKYSTPGHSCIQEVDNIHSNIEKVLELTEVWSPVSLLRVLLAANKKHPYEIVQMKPMDFYDFQCLAKTLFGYDSVPYTKVAQLRIQRTDIFRIDFKLSHSSHENWTTSFISKEKKNRKGKNSNSLSQQILLLPTAKATAKKPILHAEKTKDIRSMYKWMPSVDVDFYKASLQ